MSSNSFTSENLPTLGSDVDLSQILDESIVLLSILGPPKLPRKQRSDLKSGSNDSRIKWHLFLDQLSWLCDYKTGGKTVTSIAAEGVTHGSKFWLASNAECVSTIKRFLEWVLQELQGLAINADSIREDTQSRIFKRSILFSRERVESYSGTLYTLVQHTRDLRRDDLAGQPLYQYLDKLIAFRDDHEKLCLSAFDFRKSPASKLLSERTAKSDYSSIWAAVRHYVGRLGSWWKASKILTNTVQALPNLLEHVHVKAVRSRPASTISSTRKESDVDGALDRLFPFCDATLLQQVRGSLQYRWGQDFAKEFAERYTRRKAKPCLHAEILMLEHFCRKNLSFAENDRYIGCSKPSCYCCDLYTRFHPQEVLPRPCHGNTWVKWCIPIQTDSKTPAARTKTMNIMEKMIQEMRSDILSNALSDQILRVSVLESTTGLSTIASS